MPINCLFFEATKASVRLNMPFMLAIILFTPETSASSDSFADIIEASRNAVVQIQADRKSESKRWRSTRQSHSKEYYNQNRLPNEGRQNPTRKRAPMRGIGSGFIVSSDGFIATNAHVIDQANSIIVKFADSTSKSAQLIGIDRASDLALLKVDGSRFSHIDLGDSDSIRIGDSIVAIGSPFGLTGTATSGIVSAKNRNLNMSRYDNYLQIDASINSGNSGGPVLNMEGQVIAVSTAIYSTNGGNIGIGFAIPSNDAGRIIDDLKNLGYVRRGYLGVKTQTLTPNLSKALGLDNTMGALITEVGENTAAERGGLKTGDVVTSFDNRKINNPDAFGRAIALAKPDHTYIMTVVRENDVERLSIKLDEQVQLGASMDSTHRQQNTKQVFGLGLSDLSPAHRNKLNIDPSYSGAVVSGVRTAGPADTAGLLPGDLILKVNNVQVRNSKECIKLLQEKPNNNFALLMVLRRDNHIFIGLKKTPV